MLYTHTANCIFTRNSVGDKKKERLFSLFTKSRRDTFGFLEIQNEMEISMATKTFSLYGNRGTTNGELMKLLCSVDVLQFSFRLYDPELFHRASFSPICLFQGA